MLKTIKTTKKMRLDELIKYIFENDIKSTIYVSDSDEVRVTANWDGAVEIKRLDFGTCVHQREVFTVEIEEPINNTTTFKSVVGVLNNDEIMLTNMHTTIEGIQDRYGYMKEIYAVIDGKLQLVWERDE